MSKKPLIVLFNYGGGLRGIIPAVIMSEIEKTTGLYMTDMVDIFTGPSTGSILNTALNIPHPTKTNRPRFKAKFLIRFYEREGINIFPSDAFRAFRGIIHDFNNRTMKIEQLNNLLKQGHYNPSYLKKSLRVMYGKHKLSDSIKTIVIPAYNIDSEGLQTTHDDDESPSQPVHKTNNLMNEGGHAVWFKNIKFTGAKNIHPPQEIELFDAVMGSTAAPTYFPCHHFKVIDKEISYSAIDGTIFDNPCMSYMGALRQHIPDDREVYMIILGTGYANRSFKSEEWNKFGSLGVVDPVNDLPLINILFHASESALMDSFADEVGENIFNFNKSLITDRTEEYPSTRLDDGSKENMEKLKNFAHMIIEENKNKFEEMCNLLVNNYENKNKSTSKNKSIFSFFKRK